MLKSSILMVFAAVAFPSIASAQVWIDAAQADGKVPDWVEAKYLHPDPTSVSEPRLPCRPSIHRIWVEPIYQTVHDRVWVDGHYETHTYTTVDRCGCPATRSERLWIPAHEEWRERMICVTPGHYETVEGAKPEPVYGTPSVR